MFYNDISRREASKVCLICKPCFIYITTKRKTSNFMGHGLGLLSMYVVCSITFGPSLFKNEFPECGPSSCLNDNLEWENSILLASLKFIEMQDLYSFMHKFVIYELLEKIYIIISNHQRVTTGFGLILCL